MNSQPLYEYSYSGSMSYETLEKIHAELFPSVQFKIRSYLWTPPGSQYNYTGPISYENMDLMHFTTWFTPVAQMPMVDYGFISTPPPCSSPLEITAAGLYQQFGQETSNVQNLTNPYTSTIPDERCYPDNTGSTTGYADTFYENVSDSEILPTLVGAGAEVSTSEPDSSERRKQLEELMKSIFCKMSEAYGLSQQIFVKNKKIYYRGLSRYENYANKLPEDFISVINEMAPHEENWKRYHEEMMAMFQSLQREFPGEYPTLNILTYKWFNDPICKTFDYTSDHNAVIDRFNKHSDIKADYEV